jgi:protease-4
MKKIGVALLLIGFLTASIQADVLTSQILRGGTGIRAMSMGGAFTSIDGEGESLLYNPAGLATQGSSYTYENPDASNASIRSGYGSFLHLSPFGYGYFKREDSSGNLAEVSVLGFGKQNTNGIDWGLSYKSLSSSINGSRTNYWSSDVGMLLHLTRHITVGIAALDMIKNAVTGSSTLAVGVSAFSSNRKIGAATDIVFEKPVVGKDSVTLRFGAEAQIAEGLTLRGGWGNQNYTMGVGFSLPFLETNYAVLIPEDKTRQLTHQFGIKLGEGNNQSASKRYALFKPTSIAECSIGGNLVEGKSQISLLGGKKIGTNDLLALINEASNDPSCKGFLIRILPLSESLTGIAIVQEIRNELMYAQKKGKTVTVYLDNWATLPEYYLASCADTIYMPELGTLSHLGIELELLKTKTFLENFGIESTIISHGTYKDSLSSESDTLDKNKRMMLETLIQNLYSQVVKDIRASRKANWDTVKSLFDGRLISAKEAKEKGLIDQFGYWRDVKESVTKNLTVQPLPAFSQNYTQPTLFSNFNRIAVIEIDGVIYSGKTQRNFIYGSKGTGSEDIENQLNTVKKDPTIRAVIIRVNSPGGSILAAEEIYQAIEKVKKAGKLVYTSMGNLAASGGYYVAMNSNKIYANTGTLTGSIGVISQFQNKAGLNDMLGIERESIKTGKYMDLFSENKAMTDDERALLKRYQENSYALFTDRVMTHRKLTSTEINEIAQGQAFTGEQALKLKLVDKLGGFYKTVADLRSAIPLSGKPELVYFRPNQTYPLGLSPFDFIGGLFNHD